MRTLLFWLALGTIFALSMNVEAIRNDADLILYYSFDEDDDKEVADDTGNGFDAEVRKCGLEQRWQTRWRDGV